MYSPLNHWDFKDFKLLLLLLLLQSRYVEISLLPQLTYTKKYISHNPLADFP